jgi:tRNA(fMet)-specific endonuclease VapC
MNKYLLDTNMIIFLLRNKYRMADKMAFIGLSNCFISEITLAELKVGAEKSNDPAHARMLVDTFEKTISVLPITNVLTIFASEKVRLEKAGTPMHDNFDVLIAATAIHYNLVIVTNNVKHFVLFAGVMIEDWSNPLLPIGFR